MTTIDHRQSASTPLYPCNRGIPNGPRGFHEFQSLPGGLPTCRYCGATSRKGWA